MSTLRPICVKCRLEMRCAMNNRPVKDPAVGVFPSTYWLGDEYECPICGTRIITGFGKAIEEPPVIFHKEPVFDALQFDYERKEVPA